MKEELEGKGGEVTLLCGKIEELEKDVACADLKRETADASVARLEVEVEKVRSPAYWISTSTANTSARNVAAANSPTVSESSKTPSLRLASFVAVGGGRQ